MLPVLGGTKFDSTKAISYVNHFLVTIAQGIHLFPFRTE